MESPLNIILMVLGLLAAAPPPSAGWELVGQAGPLRMVYIEPARVKDTKFLAKVVDELLHRFGTEMPLQFDFFDDREQTPAARPYTASQIAHHRAKFNFNPKNGLRRFVWVSYETLDPNQPAKLKLNETEERLPSP